MKRFLSLLLVALAVSALGGVAATCERFDVFLNDVTNVCMNATLNAFATAYEALTVNEEEMEQFKLASGSFSIDLFNRHIYCVRGQFYREYFEQGYNCLPDACKNSTAACEEIELGDILSAYCPEVTCEQILLGSNAVLVTSSWVLSSVVVALSTLVSTLKL